VAFIHCNSKKPPFEQSKSQSHAPGDQEHLVFRHFTRPRHWALVYNCITKPYSLLVRKISDMAIKQKIRKETARNPKFYGESNAQYSLKKQINNLKN